MNNNRCPTLRELEDVTGASRQAILRNVVTLSRLLPTDDRQALAVQIVEERHHVVILPLHQINTMKIKPKIDQKI